jgi:AcrR family transcriptional regulator
VTVTTRRYEQRLRASAAEETRLRILDATRERIRAAPSEPVSVERVAEDAGVARSTIYLIFGSRAGLFEALGRYLLERAGFDRIVTAFALPDAREALRESLRASVEVYADERDVARALTSMAQVNPDAIGGAFDVIDRGRKEGMLHLATRLQEQGQLRPGLTPQEAADYLWLITGFDAFDQLYTARGLDRAIVAERLITLAERTICVPESTASDSASSGQKVTSRARSSRRQP